MYISDIKALIKKDTTEVVDIISNSIFTPVGEDLKIEESASGYLMKPNQYMLGSIDLEMIDSLSIHFWLNPVNPGVAIDPDTDEDKEIQMPLLNLQSSSSSSISPFLVLYEIAKIDGSNSMIIRLFDEETEDFYEASLGNYESMINHNFWIILNTRKKTIKTYIDGEESFLSSIYGNIPDLFLIDGVDVLLNKNNEDNYSYYITSNYGIIDDIAFFNKEMSQSYFIQKSINYGIEEAVSFDNNSEDYFYGILFSDPTMVKINSMIDDMSYVFFARSDGKILRGSPLFWESRKVFSENRELDFINDTIITGEQGAEISNGFLKITGSIIRF